MPLFSVGEFVLQGGRTSALKIDCDSLTPDDWEGLALLASWRLPPFGRVEGVPRGGLPFALALWRYATPGCEALLVADDVITTGGSVERFRAGRPAVGVAAFSRGDCPLPWVTVLCPIPWFEPEEVSRGHRH